MHVHRYVSSSNIEEVANILVLGTWTLPVVFYSAIMYRQWVFQMYEVQDVLGFLNVACRVVQCTVKETFLVDRHVRKNTA